MIARCTAKSAFVFFSSRKRLYFFLFLISCSRCKNSWVYRLSHPHPPPIHLTHFCSLRPVCCERCVDLVVFCFFFGFIVALVLCVKPAPEQQRLDDAIGFLRDHAEVRTAYFSLLFFLFTHSFFFHLLLTHDVLRDHVNKHNETCSMHTFCWLQVRFDFVTYDYILW